MEANNLKEFRVTYNQLDSLLAEKTGFNKRSPFMQRLKEFMKMYPTYQWLQGDIKEIHNLRNLLIHEEQFRNDMVIPTDALIKRIKGIIHVISNPQTALDIATKDIYCCDPECSVLEIVSVMAEKIFSQVPVFEDQENNEGFLGVFSESVVTYLVGKRRNVNEAVISSTLKMKDIIDVIKNPIKDGWDFIPQDMDVFEIQKMFRTKIVKNTELPNARLGVVFITETGKPEEKMLGLITPWDLSKIRPRKIPSK